MAKRLIIANWKLAPDSPREAKQLFLKIKRKARKLKKITAVICPPAIWLPELARVSGGNKHLALGGQDAFDRKEGAWTGQIGPSMIRKSGADYLILGHSEKRSLGDSNEIVNKKLKLALQEGLRVILCVGERERDSHGAYLKIIRSQLMGALERLSKKFAPQLIVAYEPLWAIGEHASAVDTPHDFFEQAIFIRKILSGWAGQDGAMATPVLYGGSVDLKNALGFLVEGQANGLLIGRASLRADQFGEILRLADALA